MTDSFPDKPTRKADEVATDINGLLQTIVLKCAKEYDPEKERVRDYFHVGVIGYGNQVGPAFTGPLAGRDLVPISEIGNMPARVEARTKKVEDGAGGLVDQTIRFPNLALESQKEKVKKETELQRKAIDAKVEAERRSVPEMRWELEKIQRRLSGYSQVTVSPYLRRVFRV